MASIEDIVTRHSNELFRYLCRYLGNQGSAEDVLSEVFVRLIESHPKQQDGFLWRPWLFRVATNLAIGHQRKQRVRTLFQLRSKQTTSEAAEEKNELLSDVRRLKDAITKLGKKHRPVIVMRVYHDMDYEEIARTLDINIGTVKSRISEAKQRLKEMMGEG